jgi:hypothetical protein
MEVLDLMVQEKRREIWNPFGTPENINDYFFFSIFPEKVSNTIFMLTKNLAWYD